MTYTIYFRHEADRVPQHVSLRRDYTLAGEVEADSRGAISRAVQLATHEKVLVGGRDIRQGDVAVDDKGVLWIFTPPGQWATVASL